MWIRSSAACSAALSLALLAQPAAAQTGAGLPVAHFMGPDPMGCALMVLEVGAGRPAVAYARIPICPDGMLWDSERERTVAAIAGRLSALDWAEGDGPILAESIPGFDGAWEWELYVDAYTGAIRSIYASEVVDTMHSGGKDGDVEVELASGDVLSLDERLPPDTWMVAVMEELTDQGTWETLIVEPSFVETGGQSPLWPLYERILPAPGTQWLPAHVLAADAAEDWRSLYDPVFPFELRSDYLDQLGALAGRDGDSFDDVYQAPVGPDTLIFPVIWGDLPHPHPPLAWCGGNCGDRLRALDVSALGLEPLPGGMPRSLVLAQHGDWLVVTPEDEDQAGALVFRAGDTVPALTLPQADALSLLDDPAGAAPIFQRAFGTQGQDSDSGSGGGKG